MTRTFHIVIYTYNKVSPLWKTSENEEGYGTMVNGKKEIVGKPTEDVCGEKLV